MSKEWVGNCLSWCCTTDCKVIHCNISSASCSICSYTIKIDRIVIWTQTRFFFNKCNVMPVTSVHCSEICWSNWINSHCTCTLGCNHHSDLTKVGIWRCTDNIEFYSRTSIIYRCNHLHYWIIGVMRRIHLNPHRNSPIIIVIKVCPW